MMISLPLKQSPKSLCVLRLSAIGDVTHVLPIIHTLQQVWPECKLTWIIGKTEATLVGDIENVEFIIFDKKAGLKAFRKLRQDLRGRSFDVLLNLQAALRAGLVSLAIKSPIKLGFDRQRAVNGQWLFTNFKIAPQHHPHVLDGFFGFLEKLGISDRTLSWDIPIPDSASTFAARWIQNDRRLLLINPCSSNRPNNWRNWKAERYAAVGDYVINTFGAQVILTGGPSKAEQHFANEIQHYAANSLVNLVGHTDLKQLFAIITRADAIISPDTGPAHMATAARIPVVGLFASSNPVRTGPYLSLEHCVNRYPEALETYSKTTVDKARWGLRVRDATVMDLIQVEDVIAKLERIFSI